MAPRERLAVRPVTTGTQGREGHHQERPRRLDRRRDQPLGGDNLETGGKVEPPAQPCLGDQGIENRPD